MKLEKLCPATKDYIWGGDKLKIAYGKTVDTDILAESWELSFHKSGLTMLGDGKTLAEAVDKTELGRNCDEFAFFPVLNKFIDARENLSVQVHPSDDYAKKHENGYGKTEMWYIVEADEGAGIYLGFREDVMREQIDEAVEKDTLLSLLNFFEVKSGEWYHIPSGTVHAIGAGCLIYEIQQNSDLTYRVYDYKRKDKNGLERELHIEKAREVMDVSAYKNSRVNLCVGNKNYIGIDRYFTVSKYFVREMLKINQDKNSFKTLTCVAGIGRIEDKPISAGDSYFLAAGEGEIKITGDMTIIMTEIRKYYIGIDLGGTYIKGGIVNDIGEILVSDKVPTEREKGAESVAANISSLVKDLLSQSGVADSAVDGIGIGIPGMIDSEGGIVVYSNNLMWKDFPIADIVSKDTGFKTKIANDANVAILGEVRFGAAKGMKNAVMLTLGTGVGSGIVIDGKLFEGNGSAGAEIGHMGIAYGGEKCSCGRRGCFESYASATALIRETKRAMEADKTSKMWESYTLDTVDGETAFRYAKSDESAERTVDAYIEKLAYGITNVANIFRPDIILLGGGICGEGDALTEPLRQRLASEIYAGDMGPAVEIKIAELGNRAGILGAAALIMD